VSLAVCCVVEEVIDELAISPVAVANAKWPVLDDHGNP